MTNYSHLSLRASGLQSLETQRLWKYLKEIKVVNKTVYVYGEDRMAIDGHQIGKKKINRMIREDK